MKTLRKYESCQNMFGELSIHIINRLENLLRNPSQKTWDNAHTIILGRDGFTTLWQSVIAVDPTFPRSAKLDKHFNTIWDRIPDNFTLRRAIKYAQTT